MPSPPTATPIALHMSPMSMPSRIGQKTTSVRKLLTSLVTHEWMPAAKRCVSSCTRCDAPSIAGSVVFQRSR